MNSKDIKCPDCGKDRELSFDNSRKDKEIYIYHCLNCGKKDREVKTK